MNCHFWNLIFLVRKSSIINAGDDYKIIVKVLVFQEYLKLQSKLSHTIKQKFSAFASCQALTAYHVFEYLVTLLFWIADFSSPFSLYCKSFKNYLVKEESGYEIFTKVLH